TSPGEVAKSFDDVRTSLGDLWRHQDKKIPPGSPGGTLLPTSCYVGSLRLRRGRRRRCRVAPPPLTPSRRVPAPPPAPRARPPPPPGGGSSRGRVWASARPPRSAVSACKGRPAPPRSRGSPRAPPPP